MSPRAAAIWPRHRSTCARIHLSSESPRAGFPRVEDFHRLVDPAELEQRTRRSRRSMGDWRARTTRAPARASAPRQSHSAPRRSVPTPQSGQPDDREVIGRMKSRAAAPRGSSARVDSLPREVELAAMDSDPGNREMVLGYLDSVLKRDVARPSGMLGGELPAAQLELDERRAPRGRRRFAARRARASARTRPREIARRCSSPMAIAAT